MELIVGSKYRLGRKIGSGSFGDIYLGEYGRSSGVVMEGNVSGVFIGWDFTSGEAVSACACVHVCVCVCV